MTFNKNIRRYRNILLYCADKCEWDTFKVVAGKLFDYVEATEMSEIERRFLKIFRVIMVALLSTLVFTFKANLDPSPELVALKRFISLAAIGGSCFELYFFLNFRLYMDYKTALYKRRRERFIIDIENDFRNICLLPNA